MLKVLSDSLPYSQAAQRRCAQTNGAIAFNSKCSYFKRSLDICKELGISPGEWGFHLPDLEEGDIAKLKTPIVVQKEILVTSPFKPSPSLDISKE